ncbi:hypothetical protein [Desulfolutivibrio sp.]|uniref:hypothetical protein n=1 Tax=Desulfolutivibrio sp. TaxID=2773296 RepID=UPI002F967CD3
MLLWRTLTEKSLSPKLVGKMRRYHLTRGEGVLSFQGELLAYHRHVDQEDAPDYPGVSHLITLALFRTKKGRFVVYYIVEYPDNEHLFGQHQYVTHLPEFADVTRFVAAMAYINVEPFRTKVISEATTRLSPSA